jgi:hypothetical protein
MTLKRDPISGNLVVAVIACSAISLAVWWMQPNVIEISAAASFDAVAPGAEVFLEVPITNHGDVLVRCIGSSYL